MAASNTYIRCAKVAFPLKLGIDYDFCDESRTWMYSQHLSCAPKMAQVAFSFVVLEHVLLETDSLSIFLQCSNMTRALLRDSSQPFPPAVIPLLDKCGNIGTFPPSLLLFHCSSHSFLVAIHCHRCAIEINFGTM